MRVRDKSKGFCVHSNTHYKILIILHFLLIFSSFGAVFSKMAANAPILSDAFFACYTAVLIILAIYAIGWQQIIKHLPLTMAYANKAITVVWGILWGILFFGDTLTWGKVLGAVLVVAGVILWGFSGHNEQGKEMDRHAG